MCQYNYVAINRVNQFGCRICGYELHCYETGEIIGMSESTIIKMLKAGGRVLGLALDESNKLILDEANHFQTNIMERKTLCKMEAVNGDVPVNTLYTLLSVKDDKYELMNSRYAKKVISKDELITYINLGLIQSGCKIENGELVVADVFKASATIVKEADKAELPVAEEKGGVDVKPAISKPKTAKAETKPADKKPMKPEDKKAETKKLVEKAEDKK